MPTNFLVLISFLIELQTPYKSQENRKFKVNAKHTRIYLQEIKFEKQNQWHLPIFSREPKLSTQTKKEKDSIFGALADTQEINHTIQELKKTKSTVQI